MLGVNLVLSENFKTIFSSSCNLKKKYYKSFTNKHFIMCLDNNNLEEVVTRFFFYISKTKNTDF